MKKLFSTIVLLVAALSVHAKIVTKPVAYEQAGEKLEGWLAYDDARTAAGRLPGVLVVHEWWGLNDYVKGRAEQLARLGYVAFALDMYGKGVVTTDPKKATELSGRFYGQPLMAERAQAGLDQLLQTGLVDPARVAAIGYCFGGSTVQALAYSGAPLAGIVSFHGGLIPVTADAAARTKARILVCQGALDPFVPKESRDAFLKSMDEGKFDYQFVTYAGAVHAFTNPEADRIRAATGLTGLGYNAAADRSSWAHMQVFFDEIFTAKSRPDAPVGRAW
jgi:dienelactone hydrolase